MRHNHPVTSESAQLYPRNRRLDKHEQEAVDELLRLPYDNSLVLDIIKSKIWFSVYDFRTIWKSLHEDRS